MNDCARTLYAYRVEARSDLPAPWDGWKLRGAWLVSPDGDRINVQRLRGLLFQEKSRQRVQRSRPSTTATVVRLKSGLQDGGSPDLTHSLPAD